MHFFKRCGLGKHVAYFSETKGSKIKYSDLTCVKHRSYLNAVFIFGYVCFFSNHVRNAHKTANSNQPIVGLHITNAIDQDFVFKIITLNAIENNHSGFYFV